MRLPVLRDWLMARGLQLVSDRGDDDLARELLTSRWVDVFHGAEGRIVLARPA